MNLIFSKNKYDDIFKFGIDYFNSMNFHSAHNAWERIWKDGAQKDRKKIKGFIQLTGAIINNKRGKSKAAKYLIKKAIENISKNNFKFVLDQDKLINDIEYLNKKGKISIILY